MKRFISTSLLLLPMIALAAPQPIVRVSLNKSSVAPGEPVEASVTILVPTWMPNAPVFPDIEIPNLIVRQPSESTTPTSDTVQSETWSGVIRNYQLYPMTAGTIELSPQSVQITFADPETRKPITTTISTAPLTLEVALPAGGEDIDPFIAAQALKLEQSIEGGGDELSPGDTVTRTVTATITGSSPMFIPPLITPVRSRSLTAYPKEPIVEETVTDEGVSGTRTERVVYVASGGGDTKLPDLEVGWYNQRTGAIESATAPGIEVEVDGPPASITAIAPTERTVNWRVIALGTATLIAAVAAVWLLFKRLMPPLRDIMAAKTIARLASEKFAYAQIVKALRTQDLGAALAALLEWNYRLPPGNAPEESALRVAMSSIGATRFSGRSGGNESDPWRKALVTLEAVRDARLALNETRKVAILPPLNPVQNQTTDSRI